MNFPWIKRETHENEMAELENRLTTKFNRQIKSMLSVVATATDKTIEDIRSAVQAAVEAATGRLEKAEARVTALKAELKEAEAEVEAAKAELAENAAVLNDIS
ncbi:MAG: hypothetical protein H6773_00555 [Pseudomonadales bacterium]|nr:hypothetical protein [Pseudomonadales bacterium]